MLGHIHSHRGLHAACVPRVGHPRSRRWQSQQPQLHSPCDIGPGVYYVAIAFDDEVPAPRGTDVTSMPMAVHLILLEAALAQHPCVLRFASRAVCRGGHTPQLLPRSRELIGPRPTVFLLVAPSFSLVCF